MAVQSIPLLLTFRVNKLLVCRSVPTGAPTTLAEFAREVHNESKPRFNITEAREVVNVIMRMLPTHFGENHQKEWDIFFDTFPESVREVPSESVDWVRTDAVPPCKLNLPTEAGIGNYLVRAMHSLFSCRLR